MKKLLLILLCLPLFFSSCQKCQECAPAQRTQEVLSGYEQVIIGYEQIIIEYAPDGMPILGNGDPIYEDQAIYVTYPTPFEEVCRDNFNNKQDYDQYIKVLEDDLGYTCKSDFWN